MSTLPIDLNPKNLTTYTTQNLAVPCEGPRAIPLMIDFSLNPSYSINLQNTSALQSISQIQAFFVDNSLNASVLNISNPQNGQNIIIPPGKQAYLNVVCPNPAQLIFTSSGGVKVFMDLLNFPVTNCVWG
jgi:hypothetical protein